MSHEWTIAKLGRWHLKVLWLPASKRFGPWPLWSWGLRVGYAFDIGYLRVAAIAKTGERHG